MDIGAWLRDLGLERYADSFEAHAIDSEVLLELTEADLEKLGVVLGHRKKLLKAIAALRESDKEIGKPGEADASRAPRREAERRQLTVLFCDLVGSTELCGAARSRGHGRGDPRLSGMLRRGGRALGRARRQVHGRWRARLLRLAAGARGRGRAGGARRARAGRGAGAAGRRQRASRSRPGLASPPGWSWSAS